MLKDPISETFVLRLLVVMFVSIAVFSALAYSYGFEKGSCAARGGIYAKADNAMQCIIPAPKETK